MPAQVPDRGAATPQPLRVLHAYKVYLPDIRGGIPTAIQHLAAATADSCRASVLVTRERRGPATIEVEGLTVRRSYSLGTLFSTPIAPLYPLQFWSAARQADLVAYHYPFPLIDLSVSLWFPRQCGLVVHWHGDITEQRLVLPLVRGIIRRALRRADRIIATSPVMIEQSEFLRPLAHKCEVVPYWIDIPSWTQLTDAERNRVAELRQRHPRLVVAAGRLVRYKGFATLLSSFAKVDGQLAILGAGPLEGALRAQIATLGIQDRVQLTGTQYRPEEFKCLLHAAKMFVMPSVGNSESFGIVQLEAMAC
ncbi:MAG TPA: glycosyltransferase, partial [Stellaceae bacterium]|nr:glycosyltransferase [Stellaceae bacterium]